MRSSRVTQLEVARHAGVSRTTASFVLSGRPDTRISEDARQRVLRAARQLDYRPNLTARALRTSESRTIALISDTIAGEPYAGQIVYGSLAAATMHDYVLLVGETEGDPRSEARVVDSFLDRQVDGFVYAAMYTRTARVPGGLRSHPHVLLNCSTDEYDVPAVIPDEINAGRTAADALLRHGHREHIYLVGEPAPAVFAGAERVAGVVDALGAARAALAGVVACSWQPPAAYEAVRAFLAAGGTPLALVCLNDRIALGTYQALHEAGLAVPDDVSVVSFDDSDLAAWMRPALTSVGLPHHEMGRRAVEALIAGTGGATVTRVAMPLRERASIGPPRR